MDFRFQYYGYPAKFKSLGALRLPAKGLLARDNFRVAVILLDIERIIGKQLAKKKYAVDCGNKTAQLWFERAYGIRFVHYGPECADFEVEIFGRLK